MSSRTINITIDEGKLVELTFTESLFDGLEEPINPWEHGNILQAFSPDYIRFRTPSRHLRRVDTDVYTGSQLTSLRRLIQEWENPDKLWDKSAWETRIRKCPQTGTETAQDTDQGDGEGEGGYDAVLLEWETFQDRIDEPIPAHDARRRAMHELCCEPGAALASGQIRSLPPTVAGVTEFEVLIVAVCGEYLIIPLSQIKSPVGEFEICLDEGVSRGRVAQCRNGYIVPAQLLRDSALVRGAEIPEALQHQCLALWKAYRKGAPKPPPLAGYKQGAPLTLEWRILFFLYRTLSQELMYPITDKLIALGRCDWQ